MAGGNQEARRVTRVERFDQQLDAGALRHGGGEAQVLDQGFVRLFHAHLLRRDPGQAVEARAAQQLRVVDGEADTILEFGDASRMAGNAAFARRPITGRQVEQHHVQARGQHHLGQRGAIEGVGKVEFDAGEAGAPCRAETLQKRAFREQEGKVRGKTGHRAILSVRVRGGDAIHWRDAPVADGMDMAQMLPCGPGCIVAVRAAIN
jgi:hypothetical protein